MSNPREALEDAFRVVFGPKPDTIWKDEVLREEWTDEYSAWFERSCRFYTLLDAEAWTDAAMCFVPEDWHFELKGLNYSWNALINPTAAGTAGAWSGFADHPALALAQACLKARENSDG